MPDLLSQQWPYLPSSAEAFGFVNLVVPGYEADDILATLARQAEAEGRETVHRHRRPRRPAAGRPPRQHHGQHPGHHRGQDLRSGRGGGAVRRAAPAHPRPDRSEGRHVRQHPGGPRHRGEDRRPAAGSSSATWTECSTTSTRSSGAKRQELLREHRELALLSKRLACLDRDAPIDIHTAEVLPHQLQRGAAGRAVHPLRVQHSAGAGGGARGRSPSRAPAEDGRPAGVRRCPSPCGSRPTRRRRRRLGDVRPGRGPSASATDADGGGRAEAAVSGWLRHPQATRPTSPSFTVAEVRAGGATSASFLRDAGNRWHGVLPRLSSLAPLVRDWSWAGGPRHLHRRATCLAPGRASTGWRTGPGGRDRAARAGRSGGRRRAPGAVRRRWPSRWRPPGAGAARPGHVGSLPGHRAAADPGADRHGRGGHPSGLLPAG